MAGLRLDGGVELESGCKINLCLKITGQRPDGYHTLESYFLPLAAPCDRLIISRPDWTDVTDGPEGANKPYRPGASAQDGPRCVVRADVSGIDPQNNTLTRAFNLFAAARPKVPSIKVELKKGVPQGAGLGGGSANAAALLNFLNSFMQKNGAEALPVDELLALAARVGADVPFFIFNRPAWVSGIGEIISPDESALEAYRGMHIVLVCPPVEVSTQWAFTQWDKLEKHDANVLTSHGRQYTNNSAGDISFENSLENAVFSAFPGLRAIKEKLFMLGASKAAMSGSGSSIFGLFASGEAARIAGGALRTEGLSTFTQAL